MDIYKYMFILNCLYIYTAEGQQFIVSDSLKHDLFKIDTETSEVVQFNFLNVETPTAISIDPEDRLIFWVDSKTHMIYKADLNGTNQVLVKTLSPNSESDGLALDTKSKKIYYTDKGSDMIKRLDYNGHKENIIIDTEIHEPRAIVFDEEKRVIFWTDWGQEPNIMKASHNGDNKTILVNTIIKWPNGLAFDTTSQVLYWCDGYYERIESIKSDGTNRLLLSHEPLARYFGLAIDGDYLYITDWGASSLKRLPKTGGEVETYGPSSFRRLNGIVSLSKVSSLTTTTITPLTSKKLTTPTTGNSSKSRRRTTPSSAVATMTTTQSTSSKVLPELEGIRHSVSIVTTTGTSRSLDFIVPLAITIVVGVILSTLIVMIGIVCWQRQRRKRHDSRPPAPPVQYLPKLEMDNMINDYLVPVKSNSYTPMIAKMDQHQEYTKELDSNPIYMEIY